MDLQFLQTGVVLFSHRSPRRYRLGETASLAAGTRDRLLAIAMTRYFNAGGTTTEFMVALESVAEGFAKYPAELHLPPGWSSIDVYTGELYCEYVFYNATTDEVATVVEDEYSDVVPADQYLETHGGTDAAELIQLNRDSQAHRVVEN